MIAHGMMIDPDHLDVLARKQLLTLVEAAKYPGIISSHSWSTSDAYPRIYKLGGLITPYAGASKTFVAEWRKLRTLRDPRFYWGFGYGADINGVAEQGGPRHGRDPVTYPFKSWDGAVTFDRLRAGQHVWDINTDGVANYGLYPDWIEDLRHLGGSQIIADMSRGPEAYLQMWERAIGISSGCRAEHLRFTPAGLGTVALLAPAEEVLRGAGQPLQRVGQRWAWCVAGRGNDQARVAVAFTPAGNAALIASTAPRHRALGVGSGTRAAVLRGRARSFGRGVLVRNAGRGVRFVYGVRRGRVRFVALATQQAAATPGVLRGYLRLAGMAGA
jgi:hypothetical protein